MKFAQVAVDAPVGAGRSFSYSIPPNMHLEAGHGVWVPFGKRPAQGIVVELTNTPEVEETKPVAGVIDPRPLLSEIQIQLAQWISHYYLAPLFESLALMAPPSFRRRLLSFYSLDSRLDQESLQFLSQEHLRVLHLLEDQGRLGSRVLEEKLGKSLAGKILAQLVDRGFLTRTWEWDKPRVSARFVRWVKLSIHPDEALDKAQSSAFSRAPRQVAFLALLAKESPLPLSEALARAGATSQVAKSLEKQGLVTFEEVQVTRDPLKERGYSSEAAFTLTSEQDNALREITKAINSPGAPFMTFLLHGVTSSGKTEVYLRGLSEALRLGKRGIVLVPEISLTPQTIQRFSARFPGRVAVLHSRLSPGQQFDEWWRIKEGDFDVVIGAMSAIFVPQPDLGLIVVDEEHETTYKQDLAMPYYHTRQVALKLAELTSAVVVLGSATPSLESYHLAQRGVYKLLEMPERVPIGGTEPGGYGSLPRVDIVDMRKELKEGNRSIFSRELLNSVGSALSVGEQVILFLNRRGSSPFVQCRECGFVLQCRRCDIPLTYHAQGEKLVCHQCNDQRDVPSICPQCHSRRIRFFGTGTQRVEEETRKVFPKARILRWDRDTATTFKAHDEMLSHFQNHEADILIGTQMIAKGLHFPQVSVVGVISADIGLHVPDFRSGERTYQLLCQVAGRAGRGEKPGLVIIQTYTPEHYAISAAMKQDYRAFYDMERTFRVGHGYPPFARLARLLYQHTNQLRCQREVMRVHELLRRERDASAIADTTFIGPAPAYPPRLRGRYRWHLVVRSPDPAAFLKRIHLPQGWSVDIDPISFV